MQGKDYEAFLSSVYTVLVFSLLLPDLRLGAEKTDLEICSSVTG